MVIKFESFPSLFKQSLRHISEVESPLVCFSQLAMDFSNPVLLLTCTILLSKKIQFEESKDQTKGNRYFKGVECSAGPGMCYRVDDLRLNFI